MTLLDDTHDESEETLTLRLSNAAVVDGEATVTVENTELMPAALHARFRGRRPNAWSSTSRSACPRRGRRASGRGSSDVSSSRVASGTGAVGATPMGHLAAGAPTVELSRTPGTLHSSPKRPPLWLPTHRSGAARSRFGSRRARVTRHARIIDPGHRGIVLSGAI